jgi:Flp pilus assembly protein TadG
MPRQGLAGERVAGDDAPEATMRRRGPLRELAHDRRGGITLEFGLVAIFYMSVALGIVEIGRYVAMQQALLEAVYAGGRYAVVHGSQSASPATPGVIQTTIQSNCGILTAGLISSSVTFTPDNEPGSTISIAASYPWTPLVPLLKLPATTITAKSITTILH